MPSLLLVTYEFPPRGGPGVQRPLQTAKYLAELGWDVTVLTVLDPPASIGDPDLLQVLPSSVHVERAWSMEPTRVLQWIRRRRARTTTETSASGQRGYTRLPRWSIRAIQAFFFPDEKVGWVRRAVRLGKRIHKARGFDVVLASGPPFSGLEVGRRVAKACGVPWIADLRDPIVGGYFFKPLTPVHRARYARFERTIVNSASLLVSATGGMTHELAHRYPDVPERFITITNGWNPADFGDEVVRDEGAFTIAYVGTFQASIRPDAFLEGLQQACARNADLAADVRVVFAGPLDAETADAIARTQTGTWVSRLGFLPHREAVRVMREADVLLLVLGAEASSRSILTGKLPEYLAAYCTVIGLVPDGVAADLIRRAGAGPVISPHDVKGVAVGIERLHAQWRLGELPTPDPAVVAEFNRQILVGRLSAVLADTILEATP